MTTRKKLKQAGDSIADMLEKGYTMEMIPPVDVPPDKEMLKAMDAIPVPKKHKRYKKPEGKVKKACLIWLNEHGISAWPRSTGAVRIGSGFIRYGKVGAADIEGLLPNGIHFEIECKSAVGKQSYKQKIFQKMIERNNGLYFLVRSVGQLEMQMLTKYEVRYDK